MVSRQPIGGGEFSHLEVVFQFDRLGVSVCRLLSVDAATCTWPTSTRWTASPVLDIKPYLVEFAPTDPVHQPAWATCLMREYYRS